MIPAVRKNVRVILNADDYALSQGISTSIVELLGKRRISGISAMTASPYWHDHGPWLRPFLDQADIGIHFTLTEIEPLGPVSSIAAKGKPAIFSDVFRRSIASRIDAEDIRRELKRQWEAFRDVLGTQPSHVDGHQHIHQLPVIRDAVIETVASLSPKGGTYVRACVDRPTAILGRRVGVARAFALAYFGREFRLRAKARGVMTNSGFSGLYDLSGRAPYISFFTKFLIGLRPRSVILCHPGNPDQGYRDDPIAAARTSEYEGLSAGMIETLLLQHNISLGRFCEIS